MVYGEISKYVGNVPDKNLKHIEDFKILVEDECYFYSETYFGWGNEQEMLRKYTNIAEHQMFYENRKSSNKFRSISYHTREINEKCSLEIVAPLKDFNMTNSEIKDFKISKVEIPDPIVLKPVIFNGQKHYLIVTAWGTESLDELVVNQKFN